ncbi:hypothetical protein SCHPADRAFT_232547 [Schizopora paradoxa]|uniref:Uncharacterized protein n=1 Tax=Schizopora paradoxa TaxID=27342 RepID=A0A0H2RVH0_9AGAM|nr:hypothetical protein SCHPADRAFT_232547 [Schizopora paradoxa]
MPLFGSKRQPTPPGRDDRYADQDIDNNSSKGGLFSRNRSDKRASLDETNGRRGRSRDDGFARNDQSNYNNNYNNNNGTSGGGFFSRARGRSSSDDDRLSHNSSGSIGNGRSGSRLTRSSGNGNASNDPAILSARQKVSDAEESERMADRALVESRQAVKEARQHVKDLEREVEMEARMAKLKQQEAKSVSKSAKGLGRHM